MGARRQLAMLTLPMATLVATWGGVREARGASVDRHVETGALISKGITTFDARMTVGGAFTTVWSPNDRLELALETGIAGTVLPFGRLDGAARISTSSDSQESVTLLPRLMFGPRFVPVPTFWLGVSVGGTWIWSSPGMDLAVVAYPTATAAAEVRFGPDERFGVRAAFSYMYYWWGHDRALLSPTVAFSWSY